MCQHDVLAAGSENQAVLADHLAAAQGGEPDRAGFARPGMAVRARSPSRPPALTPRPLRHRSAHADGGAGRRIDFLPVMHLHDFRVVGVGGQGGGHAFGQRQHQVDAGRELAA